VEVRETAADANATAREGRDEVKCRSVGSSR